jgi:hypothetical protein
MGSLPVAYLSALRILVGYLPLNEINWALTGSTAHALQGVPVEPHDIDVQTDEAGTWKAAEALAAFCVSSPRWKESQRIRSLLGRYSIGGIETELIGALRKRRPDGLWGDPTDPAEHRRIVRLEDFAIPVLTLEYEAVAYAELGRRERAELLRRHAAVTRSADTDSSVS